MTQREGKKQIVGKVEVTGARSVTRRFESQHMRFARTEAVEAAGGRAERRGEAGPMHEVLRGAVAPLDAEIPVACVHSGDKDTRLIPHERRERRGARKRASSSLMGVTAQPHQGRRWARRVTPHTEMRETR